MGEEGGREREGEKKEERGIKSYLITIRINQRKLRPAKTSTLIALFPTRFISHQSKQYSYRFMRI